MWRDGDFVGDWWPGMGDGGVAGRVGGSAGELGIGGAMGDMERGANHAAPQYGPQRNGICCGQSALFSHSMLTAVLTSLATPIFSIKTTPSPW